MQSLTRSAAFEKNRGNFYKGSELELGGLLLSSAAPPPHVRAVHYPDSIG